MGLAGPGRFGADCSHLNLHKTFCIPHGGGGPGVGPLCCREHLAPHLPGHSLTDLGGDHAGNRAVAAAPYGSAGILPISWAYITMMGPAGMKKATQVAILNANYVAKRLEGAYDVLYTGRSDRVAHECIIDLRPFKQSCGDWPQDDNPLVNAPHNATDLVRKWTHPYDRGTGLFPTEATWDAKFWPAVTRVDNVYGDRNLVCACPPLSVWMDEEAA